jgi:hypothetical protein
MISTTQLLGEQRLACPQGLGTIGVRRETALLVGPGALQGGEVVALVERPGTIANRNLEHTICLHRSCLPLAVVDLGERDMTGGVTHSECERMCGE